MFDYLIRILPNGRILFCDNKEGTSTTMKPAEIPGHLNEKLVEQIAKQEELEENAAKVKEQAKEKLK